MSQRPARIGDRAAPIRVAVVGAAGRMGRLLIRLLEEGVDFTVTLRVERNLAPLGEEARAEGESPALLSGARPGDVDLLVDFTHARAIPALAEEVIRLGVPWVSGTTGLDDAGRDALARAALTMPVFWAPNFSLGVALLGRALEQAARLLPAGWELEIVETHHPGKVDAPSGTALALAERWRAVRGGDLIAGRAGQTGPRPPGSIGLHAVRLPEVVGEHRVLLAGPAEALEFVHRAHDRASFARGAIEAMRWVMGRAHGLYSVEDWLGENSR